MTHCVHNPEYACFDCEALAHRLEHPQIVVTIAGRPVRVQAWRYDVVSLTGGVLPVFFLDTGLEANDPRDRATTDQLYGGDMRHRLKQEITLGIGAVRMLEAPASASRRFAVNFLKSAEP